MKIWRSILFLAVIGALLIGLVLWQGRRLVEKPPATTTETNGAPAETSETSSPVPAAVVPQTHQRRMRSPQRPRPSQTPAGEQNRANGGILSTYNDVPIDFYGKLEDQFGNPVAGAEIKGKITGNQWRQARHGLAHHNQ